MDEPQAKINNYISYKIDNVLMPLVSESRRWFARVENREYYVDQDEEGNEVEEYIIPRHELDRLMTNLKEANDRIEAELQSLRVLVTDYLIQV